MRFYKISIENKDKVYEKAIIFKSENAFLIYSIEWVYIYK